LIKQTLRRLSCKICKNKFVCERNKENGCWCMNLEPRIINKNIKDCICRQCLSDFAKYPQIDL
jgi:hypothetical protein